MSDKANDARDACFRAIVASGLSPMETIDLLADMVADLVITDGQVQRFAVRKFSNRLNTYIREAANRKPQKPQEKSQERQLTEEEQERVVQTVTEELARIVSGS